MRRSAADVGLWAAPGERKRILEELQQRRSIRETALTFRTRAGQTGRAIAALEWIQVGGQDATLMLFWGT